MDQKIIDSEYCTEIRKNTEAARAKIKQQIIKDLKDLKSYSNPDIYETIKIEISDDDNKYGFNIFKPESQIGEALISIEINLSENSSWDFDDFDGNCNRISSISIIEKKHTYAPYYSDEIFADEIKNHVIDDYKIDILYNHWPAILAMAYEKMYAAYNMYDIFDDHIKETLKNTMYQKIAAYQRYIDFQANLIAFAYDI